MTTPAEPSATARATTRAAPGDATPGAAASGDAAACVQALAAALAEQLDAARRGDLDRVEGLARRVDGLVAEARAAGARLDEAGRRRLLDLHGRVGLALAQQRSEVAEQRERIAGGKRTAQAYRHAK